MLNTKLESSNVEFSKVVIVNVKLAESPDDRFKSVELVSES